MNLRENNSLFLITFFLFLMPTRNLVETTKTSLMRPSSSTKSLIIIAHDLRWCQAWSMMSFTAWKGSVFGVNLDRIFPHSDWIRRYGPHFCSFELNMERYSIPLRILSEWGKIQTRMTPNTDTFYAVVGSIDLMEILIYYNESYDIPHCGKA